MTEKGKKPAEHLCWRPREGEGERRAWANTGMGPLQPQRSAPLAARGPGPASCLEMV